MRYERAVRPAKARPTCRVLPVVLSLLVVCPMVSGRTDAQTPPGEPLRGQVLRHDCELLEMLRHLEMSGPQRADAAGTIEAFHARVRAVEEAQESRQLIDALSTVREALLKGEAPTPEARNAVAAAQPPDDGAVAAAVESQREQALSGLLKLLTDDQKAGMRVMDLVQFARRVVGDSAAAQSWPEADWERWRAESFYDEREKLRMAAGEKGEGALGQFQAYLDRLHGIPAEQMREEVDKLVQELVTMLDGIIAANPEAVEQQLRERLWDWVIDPRMSVVLKESAAAMGP